MSWLASLWLAFKRERNRRKRWAYRNRVHFTWRNDYREFTRDWRELETRGRQS